MQILLTKQEAFDAGLNAFEHEGIQRITELKDQLVNAHHAQTPNIEKRHGNVIGRWQQLLANSEARRQKLLKMQDQYKQIEELYLTFAKKVNTFQNTIHFISIHIRRIVNRSRLLQAVFIMLVRKECETFIRIPLSVLYISEILVFRLLHSIRGLRMQKRI